MTNSANQHLQLNTTALRDELREQFVLIARCAAEDSGNASDECTVAAMMMADLLLVAEIFYENSATCERADEIVRFCQQKALPILADVETDDSRSHLVTEATDRWSEFLLLLAPEDRSSFPAQNHWTNADENSWGESLPAESPGDSIIAADIIEDLTVSKRHAQLDMASILASLAGEGPPPTFIENDSANGVANDLDCASPATPDELETIDDPEMEAAFTDDAQQCIAEMEASLLAIESGQPAPEALRNFLRQLHTLKGASGTVGLHRLAKFLHNLESEIEETTKTALDVDRLLDCVDAVRDQLNVHGISGIGGTPANTIEPQAVSATSVPLRASTPIAAALKSHSPAAGGDIELFVRVEASRVERLMDLLAEMVMLRNRRETYVDSMRNIHRALGCCATRTRTLTSTIDMPSPATLQSFEIPSRGTRDNSEHYSNESSYVTEQSASKSRLLSRTLSEISEDTAELGRSLQDVVEPLAIDNSAVSHLIGRFRQELMELRRLPIGGLFQRLQRVIRDAAKSEGKLVEINFEGQGARAERAVQDRLFEPLLHLVRNAVSHGIDTPDERSKAGKSPVGKITLSAWSDASSMCIEVRDDGGGLNEGALESRGRERGLLPLVESVSRQQLWKLIFHPGFSTKTSVSEVSGRGVGMDVVDSWVKRLRGRIDVESEPGKGTTFRLHIPLRSAVEHAMVVRVGGQLFALPMHAVSGTSSSARPLNGLTNLATEGRTIRLSLIPGWNSINAAQGFSEVTGASSCSPGISNIPTAPGSPSHGENASAGCFISLRTNGKASDKSQRKSVGELMIEVDAIVGVEEVVVRSLPSLLQRNELFAGVTLSGRAETVLLLDVRKVIELCGQHQPTVEVESTIGRVHSDGETNRASLRPDRSAPCILLVDDSVSVRRSLSRRLQAAGFIVREATNGREALKTLHSADITAVITDLDMPGMSGLELLQEIKRQKHLQTVPITVLTSRDDELTLSEVRQLQPTTILNKPVTDTTFKAILASLKLSESAVS